MRGTMKSLSFCLLSVVLAGGTLPALAAECGPLKVLASLPLTSLGPGGIVTIPVLIGDSQRQLLVDTGAFASILTKRTVRELNLPTTITGDRGAIQNVAGAVSSQMAKLPSIAIGNLRQDNVFFFVEPGEDNPNDSSPAPFDGILGAEMLQKLDADFDFKANKLNLISQDHCPGKVTYWSAPALAVIPFSLDRSGRITFRLDLDGKRIVGMLDTGATTTTLNLNIARQRFGVDTNAPDVEKLGELKGAYTSNVYRRRFKSLAFEGVSVTDPVINLLPDFLDQGAQAPRIGSFMRPDPNLSLILGMSVLSKLHVYIAYGERKLYITAADPPAASPP